MRSDLMLGAAALIYLDGWILWEAAALHWESHYEHLVIHLHNWPSAADFFFGSFSCVQLWATQATLEIAIDPGLLMGIDESSHSHKIGLC